MPFRSDVVLPKSQITPVTKTTLQVGSYNPLTDAFSLTLDLNDKVNFFLVKYTLAQPKKVYARSSNIRVPGERVTAWQYQNRHFTISVQILYPGNMTALQTLLHNLIAAVEFPPYVLAIALPNSAALTYANVVAVSHNIPSDPKKFLALVSGEVQINFETRPGLMGDRLTLSNLVVNPGFEAVGGSGVAVFSDSFANLNAYTTVAGSAPTQAPANGYPDILLPDNPIRYYRLDEPSGTTAYDVSGQGGFGVYVGSPTLGVAGAISGDTDTAITLNGTSQYMQATTATGLPTGSAAWTIEAWVKIAANPSALAVVASMGNWTPSGAYIGVTSAGKAEAGVVGLGTVDSAAALSLNTWHHLVGTFSGGAGGTLTLYVDGASAGTTTLTPALSYTSDGVFVGCGSGPVHELPGSVDEAAFYATALSGARVTAHYNAGHSGATGTVASAMNVPSGTTVGFGSSAWGAINTWAARFRWAAGGTVTCYLHVTDANNQLYCQVTGTTLALVHRVAGVNTTLATTSILLAQGTWNWLQITQFPVPTGSAIPVYVQATLATDANGAVGVSRAVVGPAQTTDGVTALLGAPQIAASGAAVVIGGAFSNVHTMSLFGPGGWMFQPATSGNAPTGLSAGAWDQTAANTYPNGPVTSAGAARIDLPPAGTVDACWRLYTGGAPAGTNAVPVFAGTNVLGLSVVTKSSGLSASAQIQLRVYEYDVTGAFLHQTGVVAATGNQAAWTTLSGMLTTQANTAYIDVMARILDSAVAGESANGTVWFDNAQVWNQTTTGMTAMPYCELRFPQSPAQFMVSGLIGDIPAPAQVSIGTYLAQTFTTNEIIQFALGRRASASLAPQLVGVPFAAQTGQLPYLGTGGLGNIHLQASTQIVSWMAFSQQVAQLAGIYHLINFAETIDPSYANVSGRIVLDESQAAWLAGAAGASKLWEFYSTFIPSCFSGFGVISPLDLGQIMCPPTPYGNLLDPTQTYLTTYAQYADSSVSGWVYASWAQLLLPIDGNLLTGQIINPSNGLINPVSEWLWAYFDGLGVETNTTGADSGTAAWSYSLEANQLPNPAHSAGGAGGAATGTISINPAADPYLMLDPTVNAGSAGQQLGVNQFGGYITNISFGVTEQPMALELVYTPLYLFPRGS